MSENNEPTYHRRSSDIATDKPDSWSVRIRAINAFAIVVAIVLSVIALVTVSRVIAADEQTRQANDEYLVCRSAADNLLAASDYLTSQARLYVITGEKSHLDNFLEELQTTNRRGEAVTVLETHVSAEPAFNSLRDALGLSNELVQTELRAMRLYALATGMDDLPSRLAEVALSDEERAMPSEELEKTARNLLLDNSYQAQKDEITATVASCTEELVGTMRKAHEDSEAKLQANLNALRALVCMLLVLVIFVIVSVVVLILVPINVYIQRINMHKPLALKGAHELRYLAKAYNAMYEENRQRTMMLKHAAEHDPLTGLCNRAAYDALLEENDENIALLLIDVDKFKDFNDTYGHDVGDAVLKKVADSISGSFRLTDVPCRIGGDEFAVIMTDMTPDLEHVVRMKLDNVAKALRDTSDGLPVVTLSIGVAFSGAHPGEDDIYRAADSALYVVKERGRNGYAFYGEK